jgi:CRP-like cAMP-binding protein
MKSNMNGYTDMQSTFRPRSPLHVSGIAEEMRIGDAALRAAFAKQPLGTAGPGENPPGNASVILIERGVAYRSHAVAGERRVIFDLLLPGDFTGFDNALVGQSNAQLVAAEALAYRAMAVEQFDKLTKKRAVWIGIAAALIQERSRIDRLGAIHRLEARKRIAAFLLDLYDRLRRLGLVSQPRFNLPLTQGNAADHLDMTPEHFNRTLADMRDAGLVEIDRRVIANMQVKQLRSIVPPLPPVLNGDSFLGRISAQNSSAAAIPKGRSFAR